MRQSNYLSVEALFCHKTDLKIKNIAFCTVHACINDYRLILTLNEYILHSGSAVLLKHKGGDYVPLHVANTCHSRGEHRRAKKRWKTYVYLSEKKEERQTGAKKGEYNPR